MLAHSRASPWEGRLRDLHSIWRVHDASIPSGSVWDYLSQDVCRTIDVRIALRSVPVQVQAPPDPFS